MHKTSANSRKCAAANHDSLSVINVNMASDHADDRGDNNNKAKRLCHSHTGETHPGTSTAAAAGHQDELLGEAATDEDNELPANECNKRTHRQLSAAGSPGQGFSGPSQGFQARHITSPNKPLIKHGKKIVSTPLWLMEPFKRFVGAFGFEMHVAAGEVEAELAALNRQGIIDAVWTEDSDALVFAKDMLQDSRVALTEGGLLLMALFCGGDYDMSSQVHNDSGDLFTESHSEWPATHGVGDELLHAAATMSKDDLTQFIQSPWVKHVHDLLVEMGNKNRRCRVLSEDFPNDFPSPAIVLTYVKPSTMVTVTHTQAAGDASSHCPLPLFNKSHPADPEQLAFLCEFHFGWSRGGPPGP
ncbi:hypothetical protein BDN67DRAFT_986231, partial [Paxillus ammoniavirescens]